MLFPSKVKVRLFGFDSGFVGHSLKYSVQDQS